MEKTDEKSNEKTNKTEYPFTEEQLQQIGKQLAMALYLKQAKGYKDRWVTEWGTKTGLGLIRTLDRCIQEIKKGKLEIL